MQRKAQEIQKYKIFTKKLGSHIWKVKQSEIHRYFLESNEYMMCNKDNQGFVQSGATSECFLVGRGCRLVGSSVQIWEASCVLAGNDASVD